MSCTINVKNKLISHQSGELVFMYEQRTTVFLIYIARCVNGLVRVRMTRIGLDIYYYILLKSTCGRLSKPGLAKR